MSCRNFIYLNFKRIYMYILGEFFPYSNWWLKTRLSLAGLSQLIDQCDASSCLTRLSLAGISQLIDQCDASSCLTRLSLVGLSQLIDQCHASSCLTRLLLAGLSQLIDQCHAYLVYCAIWNYKCTAFDSKEKEKNFFKRFIIKK